MDSQQTSKWATTKDIFFNILIGILIALFVYLVLNIFVPILDFKVYFDWWKHYGGEKYNSIFSVTLLAYYLNFNLYYHIKLLSMSQSYEIRDQSWAYFIFNLLTGGAKGIVSEGQTIPKHICESIIIYDTPQELYKGVTLNSWPTKIGSINNYENTDPNTWGWRELIQYWGKIKVDTTAETFTFDSTEWFNNHDDNFFGKYWVVLEILL